MRGRAAALTLAAGLVVIVVADFAAPPGSPPLYDGVVVQDPYRYFAPGQGQPGRPTSFRASPAVEGMTSPQFVAATTEIPPQAQLIVAPGAFVIRPGVTSLTVSIEPTAAAVAPRDGRIAGNVYRFAVSDLSGAALDLSRDTLPTLILRAPDGVSTATIARFSGATWHELPTLAGGQPGIFIANVTELGDFALIEPARGPFGLDASLLIGAGITALLSVVVLGLFIARRKRRQGGSR